MAPAYEIPKQAEKAALSEGATDLADSEAGLRALFRKFRRYAGSSDIPLIRQAFDFANECHLNQRRKSGELFIMHPLGVAQILADLELDTETVVAGLLHDVVEDTEMTLDDVGGRFGSDIRDLIDGVTKLEAIQTTSHEQEQVENLRKMLLAMSKDIRVLLIKLADRLHNMQTLGSLSREKQLEKARETLDIYGPLAHRLGISQLKWQLEDLAFQVVEPNMYAQIEKMVAERREERENYLATIIRALKKELRGQGIECEMFGRPKHFYSIYQKMVQRGKEFSEIYDLIAVRVLVSSVHDCYAALGNIHSLWTPLPGRFKDFIAMPKFNMYQSLHTTVIGPTGRPLEIQIRTQDMHKTAEWGIAAHWHYKEVAKDQERQTDRLGWLRGILEWQSEVKDPRDFMESLRIDLFEDEVFVFTPKGKVLSLPAGATPIDFAYCIHTDVGHGCIGAKVNNRIVPLGYRLRNGDILEILTSKTAKPSRDWLSIARTSRARNKIRQWFSKHQREDAVGQGKEALQRVLRRQHLGIAGIGPDVLEELAGSYNFRSLEDLYASIGQTKTSSQQAVTRILKILNREKTGPAEEAEELPVTRRAARRPPAGHMGVRVLGVDDVLVRLARCCNPVPGDEIMGFVTRGRGISVHRQDCRNAESLLEAPERKVDVVWDSEQPAAFQVEIEVQALDRRRLLRDITTAMSDGNINILNASVTTTKDRVAILRFAFEISSLAHLTSVLAGIKKVDAVMDAYRVIPGGGKARLKVVK